MPLSKPAAIGAWFHHSEALKAGIATIVGSLLVLAILLLAMFSVPVSIG